jgi:hypothetical protein
MYLMSIITINPIKLSYYFERVRVNSANENYILVILGEKGGANTLISFSELLPSTETSVEYFGFSIEFVGRFIAFV